MGHPEVQAVAHFRLQGICAGRLVRLRVTPIIQTEKGLQITAAQFINTDSLPHGNQSVQ